MKYNDNGTYKDIYVKAFDTLPVGTEVDYDGSVVPDGWTEVEVESGTINVANTTQASGSIVYYKVGRMVQLTYDLKLIQSVSGSWKNVILLTLPDFLKPIYGVLVSAVRDSSVSTILGLGISSTSGNLYFTDRGRANLSSSNESFYGTFTYITAE